MVLDKPLETDTIYKTEDFKFVIDKDFLELAKPIKVDHTNTGFKIDSGIDFGPGCGMCAT
jgi:hypothetical protein